MKVRNLIVAASALCLAANVQARTSVFIKYEGVKGETTKAQSAPQPRPGQNSGGQIRTNQVSRKGGVQVAAGDVTGDGRADTALLLPAVQKVRVAGDQPAEMTSTQGPYQVKRPATQEQAPAKPKPKPKPQPSKPGDSGDKTPPSETISLN